MMHEFMNGQVPVHAMAMCILLNVFLVLSIAALIKYLIKGKRCCGCCNITQEGCSTEKSACCK